MALWVLVCVEWCVVCVGFVVWLLWLKCIGCGVWLRWFEVWLCSLMYGSGVVALVAVCGFVVALV